MKFKEAREELKRIHHRVSVNWHARYFSLWSPATTSRLAVISKNNQRLTLTLRDCYVRSRDLAPLERAKRKSVLVRPRLNSHRISLPFDISWIALSALSLSLFFFSLSLFLSFLSPRFTVNASRRSDEEEKYESQVAVIEKESRYKIWFSPLLSSHEVRRGRSSRKPK